MIRCDDPHDCAECDEAVETLVKKTRREAFATAARLVCPYCQDPKNWESATREVLTGLWSHSQKVLSLVISGTARCSAGIIYRYLESETK